MSLWHPIFMNLHVLVVVAHKKRTVNMAKHRKCFKLNSHIFCWLLVDIKTQNIIMEMPWSEIYVCLLPLYGNFHSSGFWVLLLLLSWRKSLSSEQINNNPKIIWPGRNAAKKETSLQKYFLPVTGYRRLLLGQFISHILIVCWMLTKRQNSDFTVKTTFRYTRSLQRDAAA